MKLSEIKGEKSFEVLGKILEPILTIFQDEEIREKIKKNRFKGIAEAAKTYSHELLEIMAAIEDKPIEGFEPNIMEVAVQLSEMMNDPIILSLFISEGQNKETSSGSVSENTEE